MATSITSTFNVQSEVGQLHQEILHRPGRALSRLTPEILGPTLVAPLRRLFDDLDGAVSRNHNLWPILAVAPGVVLGARAKP
jgi:hypothetical protein